MAAVSASGDASATAELHEDRLDQLLAGSETELAAQVRAHACLPEHTVALHGPFPPLHGDCPAIMHSLGRAQRTAASCMS